MVPTDSPGSARYFIEAEACTALGEITAGPDASGSSFVLGKAGPILHCNIPASQNPLSVWVRRKGGSISVGGEQGEDRWVHEAEEQFSWTYFGEVSASSEVRQLTVSGSSEAASIDCIVFSDGEFTDKDSLLSPLPPVEIDAESIAGAFRSGKAMWGVNLSADGFAEIDLLAPGLLRIGGQNWFTDFAADSNGLIRAGTRTWDDPKVRQLISDLLKLDSSGDIVINLPGWPAWMDSNSDGFLDPDQINGYAALLGRFAEIVWQIPAAQSRVMFEIGNGQDKIYHAALVAEKQPHRVAELAQIYLSALARIREIAPKARIGGPAVADAANLKFHEQFIAITAPALDFYSVQLPATRTPGEADSTLLGKAVFDTSLLQDLRQLLDKNSPNRRIPIFLSEYGFVSELEGTAESDFAVVWNATFAMSAFAAGVDYAAVSSGNAHPPSAHLYQLLNAEFDGPSALLETEQSDHLAAMVSEDRKHLLLAHRGMRDRKISLSAGNWVGWVLESGAEDPRELSVQGEIELPGVSLLYLKNVD